MGVLTVSDVRIIDPVLPDQVWVSGSSIFQSCIGKEVQLQLTINSSDILYDAKFYYSPALFTFKNRKPDYYNINPEGLASYFLIEIDNTTDQSTQQSQFIGEETQRNYRVKWRLINNRKQLIITHTFYMSADVASFLSEIDFENRSRLLRSNIYSDTDLDYLGIGSVYNQTEQAPKYLAAYLYGEQIKSDFQLWFKTGGISIKRLDGGSFIADGHSNGQTGFLYKEKFNDNRYDLVNGVAGTIGNVTASTMDLLCSHSYQLTTDYVFVSAFMTQTSGITGVLYYKNDDTEEVESSVLLEQFRFKADWYGQGDFSLQSFSVVGRTDNNLSLNDNNTVKCSFLYDGTVSFVDFWLVKKTDVSNDKGFINAIGNNENGIAVATTFTNVGGSLWEATWDINQYLSLEDETHHIIAVFSDATTGKVGSLISQEFGVDIIPSILAIPTITGSFQDYKKTFSTNALNAHPYDRYKAIIRLDKTAYNNLLTTQGGSFDANIRSVSVTFEGKTYSLVNTGIRKWSEQGGLDFALEYNGDETDQYFYAYFRFRALPDWINTTRDIKWEIRFESEPEYIFFTQKIAVQGFDTTFFTDLEIRNTLDAAISSFYENEGNVKLFGEITNDSNLYMMSAVLDNDGSIREWEEEAQETGVIKRQDKDYNNNTLFSAVQQQFDGSQQAEYTFNNTILEANSYAVMIAKRKNGTQEGIDYWAIEVDFEIQ